MRARFLLHFLAAALAVIAGLQSQSRVTIESRFVPAEAAPGSEVTLEVTATIEPGYHLYGALETTGEPADLRFPGKPALEERGAPDVPSGESHSTLGVESYWILDAGLFKQKFRVPEDAKDGPIELRGELHYTACTESFCEPAAVDPFTAKLIVKKAGSEARPTTGDPMGLGAITGIGNKAKKASVVAKLSPSPARAGEVVTLTLEVTMVPGWHVYGTKEKIGPPIAFTALPVGLKPAGKPVVPPGKEHTTLGITSYWLEGTFTMTRQFRVPEKTEPGGAKVRGKVTYQPCDPNVCINSETLDYEASVAVEAGTARAEFTAVAATGGGASDVATAIEEGNLGWLLLLSFFAGLFALAMPCTYPMIPITFSFFTKQADERGGKVLPLALTYGAGIVTIFVAIGLLVGPAIVPFATHWVTNLAIGTLFVVFALSLFGWINLEPPKFLMQMTSKTSGRGGYVGVFLMGMTLVVATFTCTIPFLASILGASAKSGNLAYVALSMATFGATMAIPFVFLSLVPGKVKGMPRSGEWMYLLKVFLGFVELAAALKFFSNADLVLETGLISRSLFLALWLVIFVVAGLFLFGAFRRNKQSAPTLGTGRIATGALAIVFAAYCGYGALGNRLDFVMTAIVPPGGILHPHVKDDYQAALARASKEGRLVLINFTGFT